MIALRKFDTFLDCIHRLGYGAPKIPSSDAVLDGHVAGIAFAENLRGAVFHLDIAHLAD